MKRRQFGLALDVQGRLWATEHWGLSAEYDFIKLRKDIISQESIIEVVYRL